MTSITYPDLTPSATSQHDLKNVLMMLTHYNPEVMFRYRLLGEMWQHNFMRVLSVSDNSVAFEDRVNERIVILSDLKMIIQFELDGSLLSLEPNCHYEVLAN